MDRRSIARDGAIQTLTPSRSPAGGSVRRPGGPLDCHLRGNIAPSRPHPLPHDSSRNARNDDQNAREERALDHVRPASLRLSRLHRTSRAEDAEHRRDGQARRAVFERLCAVADLRPVADVVLYLSLIHISEPTRPY